MANDYFEPVTQAAAKNTSCQATKTAVEERMSPIRGPIEKFLRPLCDLRLVLGWLAGIEIILQYLRLPFILELIFGAGQFAGPEIQSLPILGTKGPDVIWKQLPLFML